MSLFGNKKGKGCCGSVCNVVDEPRNLLEGARIKVLGTGCPKCMELEQNTKKALKELHMDSDVEHVSNLMQIAAYGVMSTPALLIDEKIVSYGKVLKTDEIIQILKRISF